MRTPAEQESLPQIFKEHGAELYWLAYLLTGDQEQSLAAFTRSLDFEDSANPVFRGFMTSWARKLIIAEALSGIRPELRESLRRLQTESWRHGRLPTEALAVWPRVDKQEFERAVLAIDAFPRCAVLLTAFERLSAAEAALLLNTHVDLVKQAQRRGLVELARNLAIGRGWDPASSTNEIPVKNLRSVFGTLAWPTCTT